MSEQEPPKPTSKIRMAISIIVPLLPVLWVAWVYIFNSEFRGYVNETASEGFFSAKEDFEMVEFLMVVLAAVVIMAILYVIHVLKVRKITSEHQETVLGIINDEKGLILVLFVMLLVSILIYAPYQKYKKDQETIRQLGQELASRKSKPNVAPELKPLPTVMTPSISPPAYVQSDNYFNCLPRIVHSSWQEFKAGEIGFHRNTNMTFVVSVSAYEGNDHRQIILSTDAGSVKMGFNMFGEMFAKVHFYPTNDFVITDKSDRSDAALNTFITDEIEALVIAQMDYKKESQK